MDLLQKLDTFLVEKSVKIPTKAETKKRIKNKEKRRALKKLEKKPEETKLKVPGMHGKKKVPTGMRTDKRTGTRLYGPNIYTP